MRIEFSSPLRVENVNAWHRPDKAAQVHHAMQRRGCTDKSTGPLHGWAAGGPCTKHSAADRAAAAAMASVALVRRYASHWQSMSLLVVRAPQGELAAANLSALGSRAPTMQTPNPDHAVDASAVKQTSAASMRGAVVIKRARDDTSTDDGMRVLVDRLWPRGLTKAQVAADLWLQEVAPSDGLRRWFGHEPSRWAAFTKRYRAELALRPDLLRLLDDLRRSGRLTLLYHASGATHNHARVLQQVLTERSFV